MFSAPGCKGKGKGKGKGKDKGSKEGGMGHTLPRTRLSAEKFAGTVIAWKGKYGWIQPSEEIEHEKAKLHNGGLFVGMNDIEGDKQSLDVGAPVEFHICEDDSGLGAEEVVQTGDAPPGAAEAAAAKGKAAAAKGAKGANGKGKDSGKGMSKGAWGSPWGGKDAWGGKGFAAPWGGKGWAPPVATKTLDWGKGKFDGGKFGKGKFDGKGKGKGKDSNKGKGHLLPRNRISAEKFMGTVTAWKGKYGWIEPAEEIQHEKANKHKGGLFVSRDDLVGTEELTPGATVEFHIWEDSSGLGAEEVVQS